MIDLASSLSSMAGTEEIIVNIRRDDVNNPTICKETMHDTVADRHCTQSIAHESPALENMIHDLRPAHCSLQSCCLSHTIQQSIRAANTWPIRDEYLTHIISREPIESKYFNYLTRDQGPGKTQARPPVIAGKQFSQQRSVLDLTWQEPGIMLRNLLLNNNSPSRTQKNQKYQDLANMWVSSCSRMFPIKLIGQC